MFYKFLCWVLLILAGLGQLQAESGFVLPPQNNIPLHPGITLNDSPQQSSLPDDSPSSTYETPTIIPTQSTTTSTSTLQPPELLFVGINKTISLFPKETQRYSMVITETKKEGVLFFVVSPYSNVTWQQTSIKLSLSANGTQQLLNHCSDIGVDVCLLPGTHLNTADHVLIDLTCESDETCIFVLETYWSNGYPMHLNKPLLMDFEMDAYAKLLILDMNNKDFKELRVILTSKTLLYGDAPVHLYANFGSEPPTKQKHEFSGVHLWDDGLGIFIKKEKMTQMKLAILVEGPGSNLMQIQATVLTDYYHQVKVNAITYDELDPSESRSYFLPLPSPLHDINIKLSTFTGNVEIIYYKDQKLTESLMSGEFQNFGDRVYRLPSAHLTKNNVTSKLYFKVVGGHSASTFVIKATSLDTKAVMLSTDISDMTELAEGQISNYYINSYIEANSTEPKSLKFSLHNIAGRNQPFFRVCHETNEAKCFVDYNTFKANRTAYNEIKPSHLAFSGSTAIYRVVLEPSMFVLATHSSKYKKCTLSIVLAQETASKYLYGIEYQDESVIKTIREGTPLKDRLTIGSRKIYKIPPLSKDIVAVHVYLVDISGATLMFGSKTDPRSSSFANTDLDLPIKNELKYNTKDLPSNHTLFIIVQGEENSLFSLTSTFKRSIQLSEAPEFKDKFNYLAIPENVEQEITIQPMSYEVVRFMTNYNAHELSYTTSFHLELCARQNADKFPKQPNCDIKIISTRQELPAAKEYFLGIGNPSNKTAVIQVKYSNIYGCDEKNLGSPWKKYLTSANISSCVRYSIQKNQSIQLTLSLDTLAYPIMHSQLYINQYLIPVNSPYIFLDKKLFMEHCAEDMCNMVVMVENLTNAHVQVLAQHVDSEIGLLDGIAQEVHGVASPTDYKHFKFWLPNRNNLSLVLESREGYFQFFVNIADELEGHLKGKEAYPTRESAMFRSTNPYYTLYNYIVLSESELKNVKCTSCVVYISVVGIAESLVERGRFIIEASQEQHTLKALTVTPGYLSKYSTAYYSYDFKKTSGSLVASVSTQNSNCATIYIMKGTIKASSQHNILKSDGGEAVVPAEKGSYSITIEATEDCDYTISVSETTVKISEIKPGVYKDLKLDKDEVAYLYYHHIAQSSFKVLSLEDFGEVRISITNIDRSSIEGLENITNFDDKVLKDFHWSGSKDVSKVSSQDTNYCVNCYYLIVVKALQKTWTSMMLYTSNIDIPLTTGDEITDLLDNNETITYKMYTHSSKNVNLSITVHYGEIEVAVLGKINETKKFSKGSEAEKWSVAIKKDNNEMYLPTHFKVTAKQNSLYRLVVTAESAGFSPSKEQKNMKFGYPTYLFVTAGGTACAQVNISEKNQKLLVSSSLNDKTKFQDIQVAVKTGNVSISGIKHEVIENTMVVSLPDDEKYYPNNKTEVSYCFTSKDYISLTLIPTASVTFFPENSAILVQKEQNLTLSTHGKLFVEVFECEGNAHILLSNQFVKLKGGVTELMHWRRFGPNYLVEIDHYGPLYLNVDGIKTIVRWQHIDPTKGQGMGYYYYRTPHYTYDKTENTVNFEIPPLIEVDRPDNYTIQGINYTLMISDTHKTLKSATQCNIGSLMRVHHFVSGPNSNSTVFISAPISQIRERFNTEIYLFASLVAEVTVLTPNNVTETYRFIYEDEQLSLRNAPQLQQEKQKEQERYGSWFWGLWGGTLVVVALFFISRIIVARYRARNLLLGSGTDMEIREVDSVR